MQELPDKVIVTDLGVYDCEYDFDILELIGSLTKRELHRIKLLSGLRGGEILDALFASDSDLALALGLIVIARRGKRVDEDVFWDAPAGSGLSLIIADREGDRDPPMEASVTPQKDEPRPNGGESTSPLSANRTESVPSLTGLPD